MINIEKLKEFLEEKQTVAYFNGPGTELITRCPWCEDASDKNKGHLYISIHDGLFNCFKCGEQPNGAKGFITKLITKLGGKIEDYIDVKKLKTGYRSQPKEYIEEIRKVNINNKQFNGYEHKKKYLMDRIGCSADILTVIPNIILDVNTFLKDNSVDTSKMRIKPEILENDFVGFIGNRGFTAVFRNVRKSKLRYNKIEISNDGYFKDFYAIQTGKIKADKNTIVLCEGVFDLLVAMNNEEFKELKENSCIWVAVLGNQFSKTLISVLDYCKLTECDVIILSDSDRVETNYGVINDLPFVNKIEIWWNKYGKDFGARPMLPVKVTFDRKNWKKEKFLKYMEYKEKNNGYCKNKNKK